MDPVVIAQEGVDKFKQENFEIIIVDTRYGTILYICVSMFFNIIHVKGVSRGVLGCL